MTIFYQVWENLLNPGQDPIEYHNLALLHHVIHTFGKGKQASWHHKFISWKSQHNARRLPGLPSGNGPGTSCHLQLLLSCFCLDSQACLHAARGGSAALLVVCCLSLWYQTESFCKDGVTAGPSGLTCLRSCLQHASCLFVAYVSTDSCMECSKGPHGNIGVAKLVVMCSQSGGAQHSQRLGAGVPEAGC